MFLQVRFLQLLDEAKAGEEPRVRPLV